MAINHTISRRRFGKYRGKGSYQELKARIHDKVIGMMDLSLLDSMDRLTVTRDIRSLVGKILESETVPLSMTEREKLVEEIQDEVLGLGPLEPLLKDPTVSDILVNTHKQVYIERFGKLESTEARFKDDTHLMRIIDKIASGVGRRVDETSPMLDARLPDGSRVNAIIPPLALDGPILSIRCFPAGHLGLEDMIKFKTLSPEIGEVLKNIVKSRLNIMISGGTGSGKTSLLNILSSFIPADERIVTIEDAAELRLRQEHVVRLETRPPNIEGKGEVTQRDLVRNSLRMRPDRIIIGEVRGHEVWDMLQAMNTGHDGSLATIHANSPKDALTRVETMLEMTGIPIPAKALRFYISAALNVIVQVARLKDGSRRLMSFQEITGVEEDIIVLQEIFRFEATGMDEEGKVKGRFRATGIRPGFTERFAIYGIPISYDLFDPDRIYEV